MKITSIFIITFIMFFQMTMNAQDWNDNDPDNCSDCYIEYRKGVSDSNDRSFYKFKTCSFDLNTTNKVTNICFYREYKKGVPHGIEFMSYAKDEQEITIETKTKNSKTITKSYKTIGYKYQGQWRNGYKHGYWITFDKKGNYLTKELWKKGIRKKVIITY